MANPHEEPSPLKFIIDEQQRLLAARDELNKTVEAFSLVTNYLVQRNGTQPKLAPPPEQPKLIESPAQSYETMPPWRDVIRDAVAAGAHYSGEIWRAIQKKYNLSEDYRPNFHQALSRTFKMRVLRRKGGEYMLRGQAAANALFARQAAAKKKAAKPERKIRDMSGPSGERGFWAEALPAVIAAGATEPLAMWKMVKKKYGVPENRHDAFYSSLSTARRKKLIVQKPDGTYFLPYRLPGTAKAVAPRRSHHKKKEGPPQGSAPKYPSFPWTAAIKEAIGLGADTLDSIWESIQRKHNLPDERKKTFWVAMPYARKKGHVIYKNGKYSLPAVVAPEAAQIRMRSTIMTSNERPEYLPTS